MTILVPLTLIIAIAYGGDNCPDCNGWSDCNTQLTCGSKSQIGSATLAKSICASTGSLCAIWKSTFTTYDYKCCTNTADSDDRFPSIDVNGYNYNALFPDLFCNEFDDNYQVDRTQSGTSCDGEYFNFGAGNVCYPRCRDGYMTEFASMGVGCIEICGSDWVQVDRTCSKWCTPCTRVCVPVIGPCTKVCSPPYPCDTKLADQYFRDIQMEVCPLDFSLETLGCLSNCDEGYIPAVNMLQCICDIAETVNTIASLNIFAGDMKNQLDSSMAILAGILAPIFDMDLIALYDSLSGGDGVNNAVSLMGDYVSDIESFLRSTTASLSRRRLSGWGTQLVVAFEFSISVHAFGPGGSVTIGFYMDSGGMALYLGACAGALTDAEIGASLGVTFYKANSYVPGESVVVGAGGDVPGISPSVDVFVVICGNELGGFGISFGVGASFMPLEFNVHACVTTTPLFL